MATFTVEPANVIPRKNDYIPGEPIVVSADVPSFYSSSTFMSLVKAEAGNVAGHSDGAIVEMHPLPATAEEQARAGNETDPLKKYRRKQVTFTAPEAGLYELRYSDDGGNGKDGTFKGFGGKAGGRDVRLATIRVEPVSVTPKKNDFIPREPVKVAFEAPSWYSDAGFVSLVKTGEKVTTGNADAKIMERHDLKRTAGDIAKAGNDHPLKKFRTGEVTFTAPEPGTYDLLLNDDGGNGEDGKFSGFGGKAGGKTVRLATIRVEPAMITPKKFEFIPRETITMTLQVPSFYSDDAIVGLVKATDGVVKGQKDPALNQFAKLSATAAEKTRAQTETDPLKKFRVKEVSFSAPEPGTYHLRFNDDGGNGEDGKFKGFGGKAGGKDVRLALITIEPVSIATDRTGYVPGEPIQVTWQAPSWYGDFIWASLVKADAPHEKLGWYQEGTLQRQRLQRTSNERSRARAEFDPMKRFRSGTFNFVTPKVPGTYQVRINDDGGNGKDGTFTGFQGGGGGKEVRIAEFTVEEVDLKLTKQYFERGETFDLKFKAPSFYEKTAWLAIVEASVGNGDEKRNYRRRVKFEDGLVVRQGSTSRRSHYSLDGKTKGTLKLRVPDEIGEYEIRLHDARDGGREVLAAEIFVDPKPSISVTKPRFVVGEAISFSFSASKGFKSHAWVGVVPSEVAHDNETESQRNRLSRKSLNRRASGTMTLDGVLRPGRYDIRMFDSNNNGNEVASVSIEVVPRQTN